MRRRRAILTGLLWCVAAVSGPASAADGAQFPLCVSGAFPQAQDLVAVPDGVERTDLPVRLDADTAESDSAQVIMTGDAVLERGDQRLTADRLHLDRKSNVLTASGNVRFDLPEFTAFGSKSVFHPATDEAMVEDVEYFFHERHAQGVADDLEIRGNGWARLRDVTYSTCDKGDEFWKLEASDLKLDRESGRGTAKNAVLRLSDVPVFYTPYLNFPIDDRRHTGFLLPRVGTSDRNGFDLTVPWYWNIAPHRDATFSPRYMSDRGLMLAGEFRYLNPTNQGKIYGSYLQNDAQADDDRHALSVFHSGNPIPNWGALVNFSQVSDDDYLKDFSDNLFSSSATQLDQLGQLTYFGGEWTSRLRVHKFQNVDSSIARAAQPYERIPELSMRGTWHGGYDEPTFELSGEATRFGHAVNVEGTRVDIRPAASLPLRRPWGYLTPKLGLSHTAYLLDDSAGGSDTPTRTAPITSVDAGLVFEKNLDWGGGDMVQTLEPRLFYLYVPRRDQDDIPIFDTSNLSVDFNSLFRENRFIGRDRLGDANQLTTALTTRVLDRGVERFRFSIGQIQYFRDREVTLRSGAKSATTNSSDILSEVRANLGNGFFAKGTHQWDVNDSTTALGRLDLSYNPGPGRVLSTTYRFERDNLEQFDVSGFWPLSSRWRFMGRWWYSLDRDRLLESIAGVEYRDCCWALRFARREFRDGSDDQDSDVAFYVELELSGLAGLGTGLGKVMSDAIPGYDEYLARR